MQYFFDSVIEIKCIYLVKKSFYINIETPKVSCYKFIHFIEKMQCSIESATRNPV